MGGVDEPLEAREEARRRGSVGSAASARQGAAGVRSRVEPLHETQTTATSTRSSAVVRAWRVYLLRPFFCDDDNSTRGRSLDPKIQRWLVTGLAGLITSALGRVFADSIAKETPPPDQRSLEDDIKEAVFHAVVSVIAVVLAAVVLALVIIRRVFARR
jgi:hypothetical protein